MKKLDIQKSTRHSKITGDFAEHLVLYWLSKYGFECTRVDHTGIDLIARNPHTDELMGISVKGRSREQKSETEDILLSNEHLQKVDVACQAFGCEAYFALVVDRGNEILVYLTAKDHLLNLHSPGKRNVSWKMSAAWLKQYEHDPDIKTFSFTHQTKNWWG